MSESRRLLFEGVTNFRDLGGYATVCGGSTRWGLVFRSDGLHQMTASDLVAFGLLGVRTVYDLRGDSERTQEPDPVESVHIALLSRHPTEDAPSIRQAQLAAETAADGERILRDHYLGMLTNSAVQFGQIFTSMARPEGLPVVIHCAGGKDRTGMAAALLLSLLGVDRETVLDDYELSGTWRTVEHERALVEVLAAAAVTYDVTFKVSNDPHFEEKLVDVVGVYLDPPARAVVFSFDEKTQCQALDRTQPSLPMRRGRANTMTHDYKRNGTTDLFAALNVATGEMITQSRRTHTAVDVLEFFKIIDRQVPRRLDIHVVLDNLSAHKAPEVTDWLAHPRRARWHLHFTPTSSSWLNLVWVNRPWEARPAVAV